MPAEPPQFDLEEIPFSYRGAWINLSPVTGLHQRSPQVHLISHTTGMHAVLQLSTVRDGVPLPTTTRADASSLAWMEGDHIAAEAVFENTCTIRIRGSRGGMEFRDPAGELTPFSGSYLFQSPTDGSHIFTSYETGRRYRLTVLNGSVVSSGVEQLGAGTRAVVVEGHSGWEVAVEELTTSASPYQPAASFDDIKERAAAEFVEYLEALAPWRTSAVPSASLAAYVLWSATVERAGFVTRDAILMSKHWMDKIWSWDHAFNALALAPGMTEHALDQFFLPFDHQDASGALPDSVAHSEVLYNFVKPPIHGWAFNRLRQTLGRELSQDELVTAYDRLSRWTEFWLRYRTAPGRSLPHYQHGNDSGWDNATIFDRDRVVESPDLAAFLLIQLDTVANLADELGLAEGAGWRVKRDAIRAALLSDLHDAQGFFARGAHSGETSSRTSLLPLLALIASSHFPRDITAASPQQIQDFVTAWGPATEKPDSAHYQDDGYWRGPIWAPSTLLVVDGLRQSGYEAYADDIAQRFLRLCERAGFAENFDAVSGIGLRDRAYTWTASTYLLLAREKVETIELRRPFKAQAL